MNVYERGFAKTIIGGEAPTLAFWRGRAALWTILRAIALAEGDEVVLPAYTCEVVPITVKFAGAKCAYIDVDNHNFNIPAGSLLKAITGRTRVVLCQHTYGVPQPAQEFESLLRGKPTALIEDCCQLIISESTPAGVGTTGAASFFSTQWNKPFSTGLGGMAAFKNQDLYSRAKDVCATFRNDHEHRRAWLLALQILLYRLTVRPSTQAWAGAMYRSAQRWGWNHGTTTVGEFGDDMPPNYLAGATDVQALVGLEQLRGWPGNVRHRKQLTEFYLDRLSAMGVDTASLQAGSAEPVLWAVPLLVENKSELLSIGAKKRLPIATWFDRTPVHIDPATAVRYDYRPGQCPNSEYMFSREVHLPTAPWVTIGLAEKTANFLGKYARFASI